MRHEARPSTLLRRLAAPWTVILVLTSLFQFFRGSPSDGVLFGGVALVLVLDALGLVTLPTTRMPRLAVLSLAAAVLGLALVLAPRHGLAEGIIVGGIGLGVLVLAWPDHEGSAAPRAPLRTAGIVWAVVAVCACLVELGSFLLGAPSAAAEFEHPSISLLLDPALNIPEGRAVFTALWLVGGVALVRRGVR